MSDLTADIQAFADAEHARQPVCSWCGRPGVSYEHHGVAFDGLTACEGDRLCSRCRDTYTLNTPLLVEDIVTNGEHRSSRVYDLNRNTAAWSEEHIPGCHGEPLVQVIAAEYRYRDYQRPPRQRRNGA